MSARNPDRKVYVYVVFFQGVSKGGLCEGGKLSALKSQRFLRFAIAMPIADQIASDFRVKRKQCCLAF